MVRCGGDVRFHGSLSGQVARADEHTHAGVVGFTLCSNGASIS